jgi:hypothetical protein
MKYFTILIFIIFSTGAAHAQEYVITLNAQEDSVLAKRNFYFDVVEDARDKNQGTRVVGHFGKNNKTTALLEKDPETFFLDYLNIVYPKRSNDKALTLRINKFECSSTGGMLSEAMVKIDIDIVDTDTGEDISNIAVERTRQPLMGGKTFGVLIEDIIASGMKMIKPESIK